jgi:hypothetical protein
MQEEDTRQPKYEPSPLTTLRKGTMYSLSFVLPSFFTYRLTIIRIRSTESTPRLIGKTAPEAILKTALTFVPEHGWTSTSIAKAAESMGYPSIIHGMFPNGGADLIDYFLQDCLNRLPLELEGRMEG